MDDAPASIEAVIDEVIHHVAEIVVVFDLDGMILWANEAIHRDLGWPREHWAGRHGIELLHPDDVALALELLVSAKATGAGVKEPVVYRLMRSDGGHVDYDVISSNVALASGGLALVVSGRPAGEQRPSTAIFDEASRRVSAMFDEALIGMAQVALDAKILRANAELARIVGATSGADLLGSSFRSLLHDDDRFLLDPLLTAAGSHVSQARMRDSIVRLTSSLVRDWQGDPLYYAVQISDITELKMAEAQLLHRSTHDTLTGLANRALIDAWASRGASTNDAVLFVDLNGFKSVNDTHGHAAGDEVLIAVAGRLQALVRRTDLLARIGGDEFVVICPDTDAAVAEDLSLRIKAALAEPVKTQQATITIGASIGVATGEPGRTFDDLIALADTALYRTKGR